MTYTFYMTKIAVNLSPSLKSSSCLRKLRNHPSCFLSLYQQQPMQLDTIYPLHLDPRSQVANL